MFETCPSGNFYEYHAMAIGDQCQSAKTYLEKNFESFPNTSVDQLIKHGIAALRASAQDTELTEHNVSVGVMGKDHPYKMLAKEELRGHLQNGNADVEMQQA